MKVSELLAEPTAWTKGRMARDAQGDSIPVDHPAAVSFCLIGALKRCYPWVSDLDAAPTTTHADILGLVDEADI